MLFWGMCPCCEQHMRWQSGWHQCPLVLSDKLLGRRLLKHGWTHDLIVKIALDQGKSGQKTRFQREGLDQLYKMIENGEASAIACYDASRLWRDRTHIWYNDLIQLLKQHNIPVVMWSYTYWPNRPADEEGLREEFRQAAHELKRIYKMNEAKLQAIEYGLSYGGGSVPIGYIVREEPGRKFFIPYEPHAERVRYLYKRYRELGGNMARLGRELAATGFCFPAFEGVTPIPNIRLDFDADKNGYVIKTRAGLAWILTNPAYLGWLCYSRKTGEMRTTSRGTRVPVYETVVLSKEAHEAIVPYDDVIFAHSRLSKYTLDGELNPHKPVVERTYQSTPALLENILSGNGIKAYVVGKLYRAKRELNNLSPAEHVEINVPVKMIDDAFAKGFVNVLIAIKQAAKKAGEPTAMDALAATIDQLSQEKAAEIGDIAEALKNVEQGIKEWELQKKVALKELYEPGVEEAIRQLKSLHATKDMLLEKQKERNTQLSELAKTQSLLEEATTQWEKMIFEDKKQLVNLIVASAEMTMVSPHILALVIELKPPVQGRLLGHLYRTHGSSVLWTDEEHRILKELYPESDRGEVLKALPNRNWVSIMLQASTLGVARRKIRNTSPIPDRVAYADYELIQRLRLYTADGEPKKSGARWVVQGEIGLLNWEARLDDYTMRNNIDNLEWPMV
jgi:hypothetical protein